MGTDHELDLDHDADDEFDDMNMPSGDIPDVAHMVQGLLQQVFGPNYRTTGTYTAEPSLTGDDNEQQGRPNANDAAAEGNNIGSQTPLSTITQYVD